MYPISGVGVAEETSCDVPAVCKVVLWSGDVMRAETRDPRSRTLRVEEVWDGGAVQALRAGKRPAQVKRLANLDSALSVPHTKGTHSGMRLHAQ